jgi:Ca2+-binding RTX toxin-like protein
MVPLEGAGARPSVPMYVAMPLPRSRRAALAALLTIAALTAGAAAQAGTIDVCALPAAGVSCSAGEGRQTPGGNGSVSHAGWPAVTGVLRQADDGGRALDGGEANDELLGGHGSDRLVGGAGSDILWGDKNPTQNNTWQRDVLTGGVGNDWIYPSHGTNTVRAGTGADHVKAYYGHGTIDCGPGHDTAQVRMNGAYRLANCEHVVHF